MGVVYESACNGCPECIGCRLMNQTYPVFTCDICGKPKDLDEMYSVKGEIFCEDCLPDYCTEDLTTIKEDIEHGKFV